jgi:rhamnose utilization protein RhaD (predicted bifunctional aldolase and dehydrogenase)
MSSSSRSAFPLATRIIRFLYRTIYHWLSITHDPGIVPYVMPGFDLARKVAEVYTRDPSVKGLLLLKHGIFTFGDTARESYGLHVDAVRKAEEYAGAN